MRSMRFLSVLAAGLLSAASAGALTLAPYSVSVDLGGEIVGAGDLSVAFTPDPNGGTYVLTAPYVGANSTIASWGSSSTSTRS